MNKLFYTLRLHSNRILLKFGKKGDSALDEFVLAYSYIHMMQTMYKTIDIFMYYFYMNYDYES